MSDDHNPHKDRKCHRAGFEKSCRQLVTDGACCLWKQIKGTHPQDKDQVISQWGCVDEHMFLLALQHGLQQDRMIASTDKVANEVREHKDESLAMGGALVQRAQQAVVRALETHAAPQFPLLNGNSQRVIGKD